MHEKNKKPWTKPEVRSIEVTPEILKKFGRATPVANDSDEVPGDASSRESGG